MAKEKRKGGRIPYDGPKQIKVNDAFKRGWTDYLEGYWNPSGPFTATSQNTLWWKLGFAMSEQKDEELNGRK